MSLCLRVRFSIESSGDAVRLFIQKQAKELSIEGTAHFPDAKTVQMVVCGERAQVDSFIDALHAKSTKYKIDNIELEPFLKTKDYRSSFRVIE
jgi:acylphosphatase